MKKSNTAYKIDFTRNTVTVTKQFAEQASQIGTEAFGIMKELRSMGMKIEVKAPAKRKNNNLTYAKMTKYIASLTTAEEDMKEFEQVRKASLGQMNPYQYVLNWFNEKFATREQTPELDGGKIVNLPLNYDGKAVNV